VGGKEGDAKWCGISERIEMVYQPRRRGGYAARAAPGEMVCAMGHGSAVTA